MQETTDFFWSLATSLLSEDGVERSMMMGFPCLRVNGHFFCSADPKTGDLLVKLSREEVQQLILKNEGRPFAPAGKTFREWVVIPERDAAVWATLMEKARAFVLQD